MGPIVIGRSVLFDDDVAVLDQKLTETSLPLGKGGLGDLSSELDPMDFRDIVEHRDRRSVAQKNTLCVDSD